MRNSPETSQRRSQPSKIAVELGPVQETLLIPLISRALETRRRGGMLDDPRAVEIVEQLDYDFDKWTRKGTNNTIGASLRTRMFDEVVAAFLRDHPRGTIVEIGCGLNTRFERIDNGLATWFDLDVPDTIALRRRFFTDQARRTMIAGSVFDTDWMDPVAETGGPWLFVSEAVMVYFEAAEVRRAVVAMAERFANAWLVTDTCAASMTTGKARRDAMKKLSVRSWFKWACDDPKSLESWHPGIELIDSKSVFFAVSPELRARLPLSFRAIMRVMSWVMPERANQYRLTHLRLSTEEQP